MAGSGLGLTVNTSRYRMLPVKHKHTPNMTLKDKIITEPEARVFRNQLGGLSNYTHMQTHLQT